MLIVSGVGHFCAVLSTYLPCQLALGGGIIRGLEVNHKNMEGDKNYKNTREDYAEIEKFGPEFEEKIQEGSLEKKDLVAKIIGDIENIVKETGEDLSLENGTKREIEELSLILSKMELLEIIDPENLSNLKEKITSFYNLRLEYLTLGKFDKTLEERDGIYSRMPPQFRAPISKGTELRHRLFSESNDFVKELRGALLLELKADDVENDEDFSGKLEMFEENMKLLKSLKEGDLIKITHNKGEKLKKEKSDVVVRTVRFCEFKPAFRGSFQGDLVSPEVFFSEDIKGKKPFFYTDSVSLGQLLRVEIATE